MTMVEEAALTSRQIRPADWVAVLREFTTRNAGRATTLEVDAPELGVQRPERDLALRGVSYDPKDRRVEIMLGEMGLEGPHLTHVVGGVSSVDLLVGGDGRDRVLRIAGDGGQTLLRLGVG